MFTMHVYMLLHLVEYTGPHVDCKAISRGTLKQDDIRLNIALYEFNIAPNNTLKFDVGLNKGFKKVLLSE